jgi:hypothetical protein
MPVNEALTFRFYFGTLTHLLRHPREFFSELPGEVGMGRACGFLFVSAVVFTAAGLLRNGWTQPLVAGGIQLLNAVGLTFILAALGWMVIRLTAPKKVAFVRLFSIYAFASGAALLAAWVPYFVILTEPWKWWLIGTGMIRSCGLKPEQALVVIGLSAGLWTLFVWAVLPPSVP